jgi:hypothetical protein
MDGITAMSAFVRAVEAGMFIKAADTMDLPASTVTRPDPGPGAGPEGSAAPPHNALADGHARGQRVIGSAGQGQAEWNDPWKPLYEARLVRKRAGMEVRIDPETTMRFGGPLRRTSRRNLICSFRGRRP